MVSYYTESLKLNNAHEIAQVIYADDLACGNTQTTLVSGTWVADQKSITLFFANDNGATRDINFQVWAAYNSGTSISNTNAISGGVIWGAVGNPTAVADGASSIKSFEVTDAKYIAVTGSASTAINSGCYVRIMGRSNQ